MKEGVVRRARGETGGGEARRQGWYRDRRIGGLLNVTRSFTQCARGVQLQTWVGREGGAYNGSLERAQRMRV